MIPIKLIYGLPFTEISVTFNDKTMILDNVLIDTGSGGTILKMDEVRNIGLKIDSDDYIESISGIGGSELVYLKKVAKLELGDLSLSNFEVEIGIMDYGFNINGIVGMDFLKNTHSIIDLDKLIIKSGTI